MNGKTNSGKTTNKSVLLPPNPTVTVKADDKKLSLTWTVPTQTEVQIKNYNIYISEIQPTTIKDMQKVGTTTSLSYDITSLTNDKQYWVCVESVSVDGWGNGSIGKVQGGMPKPSLVIVASWDGDGRSGYTNWVTTQSYQPATNQLVEMTGLTYSPLNFQPSGKTTCYANGKFLWLAGNRDSSSAYNYIHYSLDSATWIATSKAGLPMEPSSGQQHYIDNIVVTPNERIYVSIGGDRTIFGENRTHLYELDSDLDYTEVSTSSGAMYITNGDGRFIISDSSSLRYISNSDLENNPIYISSLVSKSVCSVAAGGNTIIEAITGGDSGIGLVYQYNGSSWTRKQINGYVTTNQLDYVNGKFISWERDTTSSYGSAIYYSTNAENWIYSKQYSSSGQLSDSCYGYDQYAICMLFTWYSYSTYYIDLVYSSDGVSWSNRRLFSSTVSRGTKGWRIASNVHH